MPNIFTDKEIKLFLFTSWSQASDRQIIPGRINVIYYSQQPGKILCKIAAEEQCFMIIVGTPYKSRLFKDDEVELGSAINYLLKNAHCPVVVARQPYKEQPRSRLVSFDGEHPTVSQLKIDNKLRKISCPSLASPPPSYEEFSLQVALNKEEQMSASVKKQLKIRRHSNIINPILQLIQRASDRKTPGPAAIVEDVDRYATNNGMHSDQSPPTSSI
jgi:hypothetical protein